MENNINKSFINFNILTFLFIFLILTLYSAYFVIETKDGNININNSNLSFTYISFSSFDLSFTFLFSLFFSSFLVSFRNFSKSFLAILLFLNHFLYYVIPLLTFQFINFLVFLFLAIL